MKKKGMIIAGLAGAVLITSAAVSGTYAKYTTTFTGESAQVEVAKWAVKLDSKNGSDTTISTVTFTPDYTSVGEGNVVSGKIAPGVTMKGIVTLDLTDTEVSVKLNAKDVSNDVVSTLTSSYGLTADDFKVSTKIYKTGESEEEISDGIVQQSQIAENPKYDVVITVEWVNHNDDSTKDANDTKLGIAGGNVSIPVEITASQYTQGA